MRTIGRRLAMLGAGVSLLGVLMSAIPGVLEIEEALGLRWLFNLRGPIEPPSEVVIVSLSSESAEELGISKDVDEWPRARHGTLVDRLAAGGAGPIVFDVMFVEPRHDDPDGDVLFASAIERHGRVLLAERVSEGDRTPGLVREIRQPPIEPLRTAALATAPFILPLVPVRVSQSWAFGRVAGSPSLPSVALHAYAWSAHDELLGMLGAARPDLRPKLDGLGLDAARDLGLQEVMRRLRIIFRADPALADDVRDAVGEGADHDRLLRALIELYAGADSRYVNYYGPARSIRTIPYHEVLHMDSAELTEAFAGRTVFVGFSESRPAEQQDAFAAVYIDRSGQRLAGVEIGATMFANLLRLESIRPLPLPLHWAIVAGWGFVIAAGALLLRGFAAIAAGLVLGAVFAAAAQYAFDAHHLWAPVAVPLGVQLPAALLAALSWNHAILRQQRERIGSALGYYVPAEVVERVTRESLQPNASRELVFGTCLVTDVEQYTTLSETLHPAELGELMDAYYEALVAAVHRHGGVVSDIGGDSMIAVWPAVWSIDEARLAANRAALEILAAVEAFNKDRVEGALPTRIGLDAGQLLLGNVGASVRGEYRAVGDIVNTAARLQGLNRLLGTRALVSSAAIAHGSDLAYRPLGDFLLVGKRSPVAVFELCGAGGSAVDGLDEAFVGALDCFRAGDFDAAEAAFAALVERFPDDGASRFFLARCRGLADSGVGWDGIVRVTVK